MQYTAKERGQREIEAISKEEEEEAKKDLMLVDITSLYYHHFMAPTKLIESVPPRCTESSLLLAEPPSLRFFL